MSAHRLGRYGYREILRMCPSTPLSRQTSLAAVMLIGAIVTACSSQFAAPIDCPTESPVIERDEDSLENLWFCSSDTALAASLYEPAGEPLAGVVFVHGSGEASRLERENPVVTGLIDSGISVLSYDKRGVGRSQGRCCPGDDGEFADLIADAAAGIHAFRQVVGPNGLPIGIYGESQAAWIAPSASSTAEAEFLILTSAPPISVGEEILHEELTDRGLDQERIRQQLDNTQPTGADPRPDLADLTIPMLWIYGAEDTTIPVRHSIDVLDELETAHDLDITVEVLDGAGHSVIHDPELFPIVLNWFAQSTLSNGQ